MAAVSVKWSIDRYKWIKSKGINKQQTANERGHQFSLFFTKSEGKQQVVMP